MLIFEQIYQFGLVTWSLSERVKIWFGWFMEPCNRWWWCLVIDRWRSWWKWECPSFCNCVFELQNRVTFGIQCNKCLFLMALKKMPRPWLAQNDQDEALMKLSSKIGNYLMFVLPFDRKPPPESFSCDSHKNQFFCFRLHRQLFFANCFLSPQNGSSKGIRDLNLNCGVVVADLIVNAGCKAKMTLGTLVIWSNLLGWKAAW